MKLNAVNIAALTRLNQGQRRFPSLASPIVKKKPLIEGLFLSAFSAGKGCDDG